MSVYLDLLAPEDKFIFEFLQINRTSPTPLPPGILLQRTIIQEALNKVSPRIYKALTSTTYQTFSCKIRKMVKLANAVEREKFKSSPTISSGMEETLPALIDSVGSSFKYYNYESGVPEENRVTAHRFFYPSLAKKSHFQYEWFSNKDGVRNTILQV
jgi:hypothetical protein